VPLACSDLKIPIACFSVRIGLLEHVTSRMGMLETNYPDTNPELFQLVAGDCHPHLPELLKSALISSLFTLGVTLVVDGCHCCNDRDIGFGFSLYNIPFITHLYIIQQVYTPRNSCFTSHRTAGFQSVSYHQSTIEQQSTPANRSTDSRRPALHLLKQQSFNHIDPSPFTTQAVRP